MGNLVGKFLFIVFHNHYIRADIQGAHRVLLLSTGCLKYTYLIKKFKNYIEFSNESDPNIVFVIDFCIYCFIFINLYIGNIVFNIVQNIVYSF